MTSLFIAQTDFDVKVAPRDGGHNFSILVATVDACSRSRPNPMSDP